MKLFMCSSTLTSMGLHRLPQGMNFPHFIPSLCFLLLLALGLVLARDYGISWDEKAMYVLGEEAYERVWYGESYPQQTGIRFHGAWFEVLQYAVQEELGLRYARHIFILRHAMNYLTFWVGLLALYGFALRAFGSRWWALCTAFMLVLSPRQFGHAFFNGRDIPTMSLFALAMLTLLVVIERPRLWTALLHGITSGLLLALRVGGLFMLLFTITLPLLRILADVLCKRRLPLKRYGMAFAVFVVICALTTVVFWPLLWDHPLQHFLDAMENMMTSQQNPGGFFMGKHIGTAPWYWLPIHIVITTPLLYLALFLVGMTHLAIAGWRRPQSLLTEHFPLVLSFLWFTIPFATVILLKADLFDEWRHMYFLYPAFLLLAVHGLRSLLLSSAALKFGPARRWCRRLLLTLCTISFANTGIWMVRNHPLEYIYFSLPSSWVEGNFALDYWGLSFRQGFEWILAHDPAPQVSAYVTSSPGWENPNILTREQRQRLFVILNKEAKYILDNFRLTNYVHTIPDVYKIHSITVSGMEVLGIYRNPLWKPETEPRKDVNAENREIQMFFDPDDQRWFEK